MVNPDIFILIRSLNQTEKRYFKLYASMQARNKKSVYVRLFDAIEKQEEYDEKKLKEVFKKEAFVKQLSVAKHHLYQLILKSLRNYHAEVSVNAQLRNLLTEAEILQEKGLNDQAMKLLVKASELAEKHEKLSTLLEIGKMQRMVLRYATSSFRITPEDLINKEKSLIARFNRLLEYKELYSTLLRYKSRHHVLLRDRKESEIFEEALRSPIMQDESMATCFEARILFHEVRSLVAATRHDFATTYACTLKEIELYESNPPMMMEHLTGYITILNNSALGCLYLQKYNELFLTLAKLRSLEKKFPRVISFRTRNEIFTFSYTIETNAVLTSGDVERAKSILAPMRSGIAEFENEMAREPKMELYFNLAHIYFITGNYKQTLHWLNKLINDTDDGIRVDIQSFSRILRLLTFYELKENELMEYELRSAQRFLAKKERNFKFETIMLGALRKLPRMEGQALSRYMKQLRKEIEPLARDTYEQKALLYFNALAWIDSKINGISFEQALEKKRPARKEKVTA